MTEPLRYSTDTVPSVRAVLRDRGRRVTLQDGRSPRASETVGAIQPAEAP